MRVDQVTVNDKLAQVAAPLLISARSSATDHYVTRALIVSLTSSLLVRVLATDGVHPNDAGYRLMAPLAERAIAQGLRR